MYCTQGEFFLDLMIELHLETICMDMTVPQIVFNVT